MEIVIVEDSPIVTLMHKKLLQRCRIEQNPVTCYHGKQALMHIKSNYDKHHKFLVLLDINMPVMDGWAFIEACEKENLEKVQIIIVTSYGLKAYEDRAKKHKQVIALHHKPLSVERLEEIRHFYQL